MRYTFIVLGEPVAKGRPRMSRFGGIYTPKATKMAEANIRAQIAQQMGPELLRGALRLNLKFGLAKPKSLPKKVYYHTKRPDIDNLSKTVLDAMNGVVFLNDSQIVSMTCIKSYDEKPGIDIEVEEIA